VLISVTTIEAVSVSDTIVPSLAPLDTFVGLGVQSPVSSAVQAISQGVLAGFRVLPWASPCGANCSYTFSFVGPAYRCVELGPFLSTSINITEIANELFGVFPPGLNSSLLYWAATDNGNATRPAGLLILYDSLNHTVKCDLYNATYTTAVSYLNNEQTVQNDIDLHNTIVDGIQYQTTLSAAVNGLTNNTLPTNLSEFLMNKTFWGQTNLVYLNVYAGGQLNGLIWVNGRVQAEKTGATQWPGLGQWTPGLFGDFSLITFADLATNVQDFFANVTVSLVGANLNTSQLADVGSTLVVNKSVPATTIFRPVLYTYDAVMLWEGYACALGVALIGVIVGSYMLYSNGVAGKMTFAQVLVTTRNPTLDKICEGTGLGGNYLIDKVRKVKLKYGLLEPGIGKMGFGTEDEIHSNR